MRPGAEPHWFSISSNQGVLFIIQLASTRAATLASCPNFEEFPSRISSLN